MLVFFGSIRKTRLATPASDWLRYFWLLVWNHWTEFNETWQEAWSQRPLPSLCFSDWLDKQDGCTCLWLAETFSTSPLKPLNGVQRNLTESKISLFSTKFVFLGLSEKQDGRPDLWLAETFSTSQETAEQNSTKLDRKQDLNVLFQLCVFGTDPKNKMATLASDWLRHFRLLWNRWIDFNIGIQWNLTGSKISTSSTKWIQQNLTGSKVSFYHVCVFRVDQKKTRLAAPASDWLRYFWLLLLNRWSEFNETWQEARSQRPLLSLCFSDWLDKQDGRPCLYFPETFSTSPLKPLYVIQRNLTGCKVSTSSSEKQDGRPCWSVKK